jgi:hypothetical protein
MVLRAEQVEEAATKHLLLRPADRALEALIDRVAHYGGLVVDNDEQTRRRVRDFAQEVAVASELGLSELAGERRMGFRHRSIIVLLDELASIEV